MSPAERRALVIAAAGTAGFATYGRLTGATSVVGYVVTVLAAGGAAVAMRRQPLPPWLAGALVVLTFGHLAGGLVHVGDDVLYNAHPRLHALQYDHLFHASASAIATLLLWRYLAGQITSRGGRVLVAVMGGLGVGAVNELTEFLATLSHHGAHVGGYVNTGWDLVSNTVGAVLAVAGASIADATARTRRRLRCAAGVVAAPAVLVAATIAARGTPGYDGWRDTVSSLASPGQPHAVAVSVAFIVFGVLVVTATSPISKARGHGEVFSAALLAFGLAAIVAGVAPKDTHAGPHAPLSLVHVAAAILGGIAALVAMTLDAARRDGIAQRVTVAGILVSVAATIVFRLTWGSAVYGGIERLVLLPPLAWFTVVCARELVPVTTASIPA